MGTVRHSTSNMKSQVLLVVVLVSAAAADKNSTKTKSLFKNSGKKEADNATATESNGALGGSVDYDQWRDTPQRLCIFDFDETIKGSAKKKALKALWLTSARQGG